MKVQFWFIYVVIVEEVIIKWFQNDLVLDKEVDVEVNQEVDTKVANIVNELVVQKFWLFMGKVLTNTDAAERGWRWGQRGRPDRVDEEDRADEVQAEEDEGELVGKQKFRMQLAKKGRFGC